MFLGTATRITATKCIELGANIHPCFWYLYGGIIATIWSVRRLKGGINYDTFETRLITIKKQIAIVTCFTINYIFQGINWTLLFTNQVSSARSPYFLSVFCLIACVFDAITWMVRKHIKVIAGRINVPLADYDDCSISEFDNRSRNNNEVRNISAALRREVITCIICGLSQTVGKEKELITIEPEEEDKPENRTHVDTLFLLGAFYPTNIDDHSEPNVIDQYHVDPIQANTKQAVFTDYA
eukprot:606842_1